MARMKVHKKIVALKPREELCRPNRRAGELKPDPLNVNNGMLTEVPEPPDTLDEVGRERWYVFCQSLIDRGLMSEHYLPGVEHLCRLYDQLHKIDAQLGDVLIVKTSYGPKPNPLLSQRNQIMLQIRLLLTDFGMTPTSARGANAVAEKPRKNAVASRDRAAGFGEV